MRHAHRLAVCACAFGVAVSADAQRSAAPDSVRGVVRTAASAPLAGANVFLLETLEGALTGADGRFAVARRGEARTLVVRLAGYRELRRALAAGDTGDVVIALGAAGQAVAAVRVEAGRYTADGERGATLTPLEVVTAPGAAADVNRAIQMLPGVQPVDEGTGLFVRGGDYVETKVFVDGALLLTPVETQRVAGTFVGTVNPFLLDGITFSSGGFGARYGDALSAVADLRTQGRPARATATVSAGLAALSGAGAAPLPGGGGLRAAVNRFDLDPLFRVNGTPRAYAPAPHGHDVSGSAHWRYGTAGALKLFAVRQTNALGIGVDDAAYSGTYAADVAGDLAVLRWDDVVGRVAPSVSVSTSGFDRAESYGAFRLDTRLRVTRAAAQAAWERWARVTARAGLELERTDARFGGRVPASADAPGDEALKRVLGSRVAGTRDALFGEADWRPLDRLRVVTGARTDRSTLAGRRTVDPRLSAALALRPGATLTAAWGVYHQVPDALFYDPVLGVPSLPPMRAVQSVVGVQAGDGAGDGTGARLARVEAYHKRYTDLALQTRDYLVVPNGSGSARGVDLFLKGALALGVTGRATYSFVDAERTDPHTGLRGPAPSDVTHAVTLVAERRWGGRVQTALAWRQATGRPFTPVAGAEYDAARGVWAPRYGAPGGERYPEFRRLDLNASYVTRLAPSVQAVAFVGLTNALDRANVFTYRYAADYSARAPVRSIFNRAIYVGASASRL